MATSSHVSTLSDAPDAPGSPGPRREDELPRIVPRRRLGRRLAACAALLAFAMVLVSVVRNKAFQWGWSGSTSPPPPCSTGCC